MSQGYSVAVALVMTDRDFEGCIEAFNQITPESKLVINKGDSEETLVISNIKRQPVLHYILAKEIIEKTNDDKSLLKSVLGRVLDETHFI